MLVSNIVPVVFALIAVLGVVGNSLVLLVVLYGKQMRNTTNILILVMILRLLLNDCELHLSLFCILFIYLEHLGTAVADIGPGYRVGNAI